MESPKKYQILATLLSTLQAEGYPMGTGKYLQLETLLRLLPDEMPEEDWPYVLAPLFAKNAQEQELFYELYERCREQVEAVNREAERAEVKEEPKWQWKWKLGIGLLGLALLVYLAIILWPVVGEEPALHQRRFSVMAGDTSELVCVTDSVWKSRLRSFSALNIVDSGNAEFGEFVLGDSLCPFYISRDSVSGRDTLSLEIFDSDSTKVTVQFIAQVEMPPSPPPPDPLKGELAHIEPIPEFPHFHDVLALAITPPPPGKKYLAEHIHWLKWLGFGLVLALLWLIFLYRAYKRQKLVAEIESKDKPPYAWNIRIEDLEGIALGQDFTSAINRMRTRTGDEAYELDIPQTIDATVERGGMPTFYFQQQKRPPEYLLLIDRQSAGDHRARMFDELFRAYRRNEVLVERFFYEGDPKVVFNEEYPDGVRVSELHHRFPQSRLIILGHGYQFLSALSGKMMQWSNLFEGWKERVLFTPIPHNDWGRKERQLASRFTVMPSSLQSLGFWVSELEMEEDAYFEGWKEGVKDFQQDSVTLNGSLVTSLKKYFSIPMLQWIAACAVYPSLHWDLTLYLGQKLSPEEGSLLRLDRLQELMRLPWFVEGKIPDSARAVLLEWMEKEHPALLADVRGWVVGVLQQNPPPQDSSAFEAYRMNLALNQWLISQDAEQKKKLEAEVARLMEAGAEADFTVIKHLEKQKKGDLLRFILPDAWKKYVYPSGFPGLGRKALWKDALRWALPLSVILLLVTAYPWALGVEQCGGRVVQYQYPQQAEVLDLCLEKPEDEFIYMEHLIRQAIRAGDLGLADSLQNEVGSFVEGHTFRTPQSVTRWDTLFQEYQENIAVAYFNKAAEFFNEHQGQLAGAGGRDSVMLSPAEANNILCYYLTQANIFNPYLYELQQQLFRCRAVDKEALPELFRAPSGLYGYRDTRGVAVIPAKFVEAGEFTDALLAWVKPEGENKYGYIRTDGQALTELEYDQAEDFKGGLAKVMKDGKWGFINTKGREQIPLVYNKVEDFTNGRAMVLRKTRKMWIDERGECLLGDCHVSPDLEDAGRYVKNLKTVGFNSITWMAKNLDLKISGSFCYDFDPDNCQQYGRLYTWEEAREACASLGPGWRLPLEEEWRDLALLSGGYFDWYEQRNVDSPAKAFEYLRPGGASGFNALLGGFRDGNGIFYDLDVIGNYWTGSAASGSEAWNYSFNERAGSTLTRVRNPKSYAFSCRCVKDSRESLRSFSGSVVDAASNTPLEGVVVEFPPFGKTRTDARGQYRYELDPGQVTDVIELSFSLEGYGSQSRQLRYLSDRAGNNTIERVALTELGPQQGPPPSVPIPEMVFVEGGTFTMGCQKGRDEDCLDNEFPAHRVNVQGFYIGKYEVTQKQWREIMGNNPSRFENCDNCPVEFVSWNDIQEFIKKLNSLTGRKYRLPTEAEWEFAARGGNKSKGYLYAGGNTAGNVAWYLGNSDSKTHPVGEKVPNELGLYDMSGNVWEWVADCWHENYENAPDSGSAWLKANGGDCSLRVVRGGSWYDYDIICRVSNRLRDRSAYRNSYLGFRLARD